MKIYQINWAKLVESLLPSFMRNTIIKAWLTVLVSPVATLHSEFLDWTAERRREARYSSQTIKLQSMLNTKYDVSLKRIQVINNSIQYKANYIYPYALNSNTITVYPYTSGNNETALYPYQDLGAASYNFTIKVPSVVAFPEAEMRAIIDRYKLYGTTYNIQII
jgi:hypothetical protein